MPELEPPSKSYPPLWPSLLIAAILAIAIPVIHFFVSDPIGLTLIFLPIYIPLAFAFIWPIVVADPDEFRTMAPASYGSAGVIHPRLPVPGPMDGDRAGTPRRRAEEQQKQQNLWAAKTSSRARDYSPSPNR